ncbi:ABC transporter permease subunit [Flavonifractor plautii]|uniref:ABC transporter permease subunit n=1 Tax=Flavonifractor plautii TaxID=292800 RepID=UPI003EE8C80C
MRLADVFQSFPSIVLVLCLVSLVGPSALNLVLVLGLLGWTGIARLVYGNTLSVREKEYVLAARALGGRAADSAEQCAAQRDRAGVVRPPPAGGAGHPLRIQPELSGGGYPHAPSVLGQPDPVRRQPAVLTGRPWVWVPPGLCIILTVLCLQGIGDGLGTHWTPDMADTGGNGRISFQHGLFCAIINSTERSGPGHSDWGRLFYL